MAITLRDYQEQVLFDLKSNIALQQQMLLAQLDVGSTFGPSVLGQLATGAGKTVIATAATGRALGKKATVGFICHRAELVNQTALTFNKAGVSFGYVAAGFPKSASPVQICSLSTLTRRAHLIDAPDIVFWDECQHLAASTWDKVYELWGSAIHIGLSATPQRLDGRPLDKYFRAMVQGPTVAELMEQGHLSTYEAYCPIVPNADGLGKRGGEYKVEEVESLVNQGEVLSQIVEHWMTLARGKKTIGFANSIAHSKALTESFNAAGVKAIHLDGKTPAKKRKQALQEFAAGIWDVVWNVGLFAEGFDLSANAGVECTVECVIQASMTASLSNHLQILGRGLRPKPDGSPAIFLDCAGNILRLGVPDDEREWTLAGRDKKVQAVTTIRRCGTCWMAIPIGCPRCSHCGAVMPFNEREYREIDGQLVKIDTALEERIAAAAASRSKRSEVGQARTLEELEVLGMARGYKPAWARMLYYSRPENRV